MTLPTNIDATYPDRDAGDALHQQNHDTVHGYVNMLSGALDVAALGDVLIFDGTDWTSGPVAAYNATDFIYGMGTSENVPAGTLLVEIDEYGNVFFGDNQLTEGDPTPANDSQGVYGFAYLQNLRRLRVDQATLATVEDPTDITGIRYDAVAGEDAPHAGGTLANLTGLAAGTTVFQVRAKPGLVPEGGTTATGGAKAPAIGGTLNFRTAEMCRVIDEALQRFAVGTDIVFSVCPVGYDIQNTAVVVRSSGQLEARNGVRFNNRGQNPTVRTGTDGVSNSTTTFTSATAAFTSADVGRPILIGDPINGTTGGTHSSSEIFFRIESVTNSTTVVLNQAVAFTATGLTWRMEYGASEIWEHTVGALRTAATFDAADFKISGTSLSTLYSQSQVFVDMHSFEIRNGSPSIGQFSSVVVWQLDASATEDICATARIPADWTTYDIAVRWFNVAASSGDVRLQILTGDIPAVGSAMPGVTSRGFATATAGGQNVRVDTTLATGLTVPASRAVVVQPRRVGGDAADTLANDVALFAVVLTKAS